MKPETEGEETSRRLNGTIAAWREAEAADPELRRQREERDSELQIVYDLFLSQAHQAPLLIELREKYTKPSTTSSETQRLDLSERLYQRFVLDSGKNPALFPFDGFHKGLWHRVPSAVEEMPAEAPQQTKASGRRTPQIVDERHEDHLQKLDAVLEKILSSNSTKEARLQEFLDQFTSPRIGKSTLRYYMAGDITLKVGIDMRERIERAIALAYQELVLSEVTK